MNETLINIPASFASRLHGSKHNFIYRNTVLDINDNGSIKTEAPNTLLGETLPISKTISLEEKDDGFLILHAKRSKNEFYEMRIWETNFKIEEEEKRRKIIDFLQRKISEQREDRPKKLMVLINPAAGWGRGMKTYYRFVAPVFAITDVETKVMISRSREDITLLINTHDINEYDGLLIGGGDGTINQVLNAIVKKINCSEMMDREDPRPVKPNITLGFLPFGSGNSTPIFFSMSFDITTIAINCALGLKRKMDLLTVHDMDHEFKFLTVSHLVAGFMSLTSGVRKAERYRILGPLRYLLLFVSCIRGLPKVNVHKMEVRMPEKQDLMCESNCVVNEHEDGLSACHVCSHSAPSLGPWTILPEKFLGVKGMASGLNFRMGTMADCQDPRFADCHLGNGVWALLAENERSMWSYFKMMYIWYQNYGDSQMSQEPDFCKCLCSEMKIKLDPDSEAFPVNADGEFYSTSLNLYLKVHKSFLDVYGTGEIEGHPNASHSISKHAIRGFLIILILVLLFLIILILIGIGFFIKFLVHV